MFSFLTLALLALFAPLTYLAPAPSSNGATVETYDEFETFILKNPRSQMVTPTFTPTIDPIEVHNISLVYASRVIKGNTNRTCESILSWEVMSVCKETQCLAGDKETRMMKICDGAVLTEAEIAEACCPEKVATSSNTTIGLF